MAVQTYSMRTDANTNVSAHFKVREFACNDGSDTVLIDDALVERLERIRGVFGSGFTITSGYRTPSYNAAVGGAASSQHTKGRAADIQLRGVPPLAVANYVEETFSTGGIGVYGTFTHVDTRSSRVIWKNNGSNTVSSTGASKGYWREFQNGADPGGGGEGGGGESGAIDVTIRRFTVVFKRPNGKTYTATYFPSYCNGWWYFNDSEFYRCDEILGNYQQYFKAGYWAHITHIQNISASNVHLTGGSDG